MDQIYIPKNRSGFSIGSYVILKPIEIEKLEEKPFFYNTKEIEPIKLELIKQVMKIIDNEIEDYDNIIITGSFLEKGFNFNDIDVIIITEKEVKGIERVIKEKTKIEAHVIYFNKSLFEKALRIDPIWGLMLNKCISRKRLTPLPAKTIDYKYLDAQLIKSKPVVDNFDYINGKEKYELTRNLISIYLFVKNKALSIESIEKEIKKHLGVEIYDLKNNLTDSYFFKKYKKFYTKLEEEIIKNTAKQEKVN